MPKKGNIPWNKGKKGLQKCNEEKKLLMKIKMTGENNPAKRPEVREKLKQKALLRKPNPEKAKRHSIIMRELYRSGKIINPHKNKPNFRMRGDKNPNWKGGITLINHKIKISLEYRLWRLSVFKRDNFTCVWCGYKSKGSRPPDIHADHIKPFAYYPELRLAIDNGRTLCIPCHKTTDTFGFHK